MRLSTKQLWFARLFFAEFLPKAFTWAEATGYSLMVLEVLRSEASARANAKKGVGIVNSLHRKKLAVDILLWRNGEPVYDSAEYLHLGRMWKRMSRSVGDTKLLCCWGGDFKGKKGPDGGHFSFYHQGVK